MDRAASHAPSTLSVPSTPSSLARVRAFVEQICAEHQLERSVKHALVLSAGEAFSNIIRHAHRHLPQAELQIQAHFEADGVVLSFFDHGEPFDIASVPHLEPGELRIGGRGVFMMRRLMDEVRSQRAKNGWGNLLRLFKRTNAVANC